MCYLFYIKVNDTIANVQQLTMGNCWRSNSTEGPIFDNTQCPRTPTPDHQVSGSSSSIGCINNVQVEPPSVNSIRLTINDHHDILIGQYENREINPARKSAQINCTNNLQDQPLSINHIPQTNIVHRDISFGQFENRGSTRAHKSVAVNCTSNVQDQPLSTNPIPEKNSVDQVIPFGQFENTGSTITHKSAAVNCTSNIQDQPLSINTIPQTNNVRQDISFGQFENRGSIATHRSTAVNYISNVQNQSHNILITPKTHLLPSTSTNNVQINPYLFNHTSIKKSVAVNYISYFQGQPLSINPIPQTNNVRRDFSFGQFENRGSITTHRSAAVNCISNVQNQSHNITPKTQLLPSTSTNNVQFNPYLFNHTSIKNIHQNISTRNPLNANVHHLQINRVFQSNSSITISVCSSPVTVISSLDMKRFQQFLYSEVLRQSRMLNWYYVDWNIISTNHDFQAIPLQPGSYEYKDVLDKFLYSLFADIPFIIRILRVENPYLLGQYYLKKLEYQNKGLPLEERELFHGTKGANVYNICSNNFDWRLYGQTKGNKFEQGVCFTPKSRYANHYCDYNNDKVMILAKVLVSKTCEARKFMPIPDYYDKKRLLPYDTSMRENTKDVFVKYCDDEFYPAYLIHFVGKIFYRNNGNGYYR